MYTQRTKKYMDYSYLTTNPASEDAVRAQMDGVVDEIFEIFENEAAEKSEVGLLSNLLTTVKTSIVNAINELVGKIGNLSSLLTTDKTSLVNAINEVRTENRTAPTETVTATGFASGWSGEIVSSKNQEGQKNLFLNLEKTTDITNEFFYTLQSELRPRRNIYFYLQGANTGGSSVVSSMLTLTILTDGRILVYQSGSVSSNVKKILGNITYY